MHNGYGYTAALLFTRLSASVGQKGAPACPPTLILGKSGLTVKDHIHRFFWIWSQYLQVAWHFKFTPTVYSQVTSLHKSPLIYLPIQFAACKMSVMLMLLASAWSLWVYQDHLFVYIQG